MTNLSRHLGTIAVLSLVASSSAVAQAKGGTDDAHWAKVRRVLRTTPLVDGHNDLPWYIREEVKTAPRDVEAYDLRTRTSGNTDIARLKQGMVGGQFWSVYIPGEVKDSGYARIQLEQIDIAKRIVAKYPDAFSLSLTAADVRRAKAAGKVGSLLAWKAGTPENSLVPCAPTTTSARYLTLTHNVTLDWADAAQDKLLHGGLTKFGEEVVREMNRLGMLVDLSHVSPGTMSDALNVTESPVIFSHSAARALVDVPRNVPDSILQRLPKNGGVVMVAFVPGFTSNKVVAWKQAQGEQAEAALKRHAGDSAAARRDLKEWERTHPFVNATIADVADHIEHIRKVASVNNVGLGSDYDGTGNELPDGLGDVSTFPALLVELSKRGWSDLRKVVGRTCSA
jgi:membrane dipeptidase